MELTRRVQGPEGLKGTQQHLHGARRVKKSHERSPSYRDGRFPCPDGGSVRPATNNWGGPSPVPFPTPPTYLPW